MQQSVGRSHPMRQSSRILIVQHKAMMPAQPMDIENDSRQQGKPLRCNSKRTFGSNLANCLSRNSLPKAPTRAVSPEQIRKVARLPLLETEQEVPQLNNLATGLNEILPYQQSIIGYLEQCEACSLPLPDFMMHQPEIDEQMRAILINWIVDVHERFRLRTQTLFLTVHLVDTYLSRQNIRRTELQLLGISSLFMACKYEEVMVPELRRFVDACDNAYRSSELLEMESRILLSLEFNLSSTSAMTQVQHKILPLELAPEVIGYCSFILQLCLLSYRMCKYKPNLLALSAIYLSNKILNTRRISSALLLEQYHIEESAFKSCLREMFEIYKRKDQADLQAVRKKFARHGLQ